MKQKKYSGYPAWMLFILTCFFSWASILTAGILAKQKKWILSGIIYSIPFFLIIFTTSIDPATNIKKEIVQKIQANIEFSESDTKKFAKAIGIQKEIDANKKQIRELDKSNNNTEKRKLENDNKTLNDELEKAVSNAVPELKSSWYLDVSMTLWIISVIGAIAHAFIIRKEYWIRLKEKDELSQDMVLNPENYEKKLTEFEKINLEVSELKNEILNTIKNSKQIDSYIASDAKHLVENYTEQISKLTLQAQELKNQCNIDNARELDIRIKELEEQMQNISDSSLSEDYKETISAKKRLLESEKEIIKLYTKVYLRIQNSITSLKQVRLDINKLESIYSQPGNDYLFNDFKAKSQDLTEYVKAIEQGYKEIDSDV